jgi:hypothetical protein
MGLHFVIALLLGPTPEWELVAEDEDMSLYTRDVEGRDLPILMASGRIHENMYETLAVLSDIERHHEWMKNLSESRLVGRISEYELFMYNRFDSPWPVTDRDAVVHVRAQFDKIRQHVHIRFENVNATSVPPVEGIVRAPRLLSTMEMQYIAPKETMLTYEIDIDPGGLLPRWLVRWATRRIPLQAIARLRKQIEKTRGQYGQFIKRYDPAMAPAPKELPAAEGMPE